MSVERVVARLSGVEVEVTFHRAPQAADTFRALWEASAARSYAPVVDRLRGHVERLDRGFAVRIPGLDDSVMPAEGDVCPRLERSMYDRLLASEHAAGRAILHAAAVAGAELTLLFAGVSGSGKSALARAALDAGFAYFGDEHVITDGVAVWGVPRAIHLDPQPFDAPPLPWHRGADRTRHVFEGHEGLLRLPFVAIPPTRLVEGPRPLAQTVLVELVRGEHDRVSRASAADRVRLVERSHFVGGPALAKVALVPRAFRLEWREPERAMVQLMEAVAD